MTTPYKNITALDFGNELLMDRETAIPYIIDTLGLKTGVEVGVNRGWHSEKLIKNSSLESLIGIDVKVWPAAKALEKRYDIFKLRKANSINGVKDFKDNSLDFVYIDADHTYKAVKQDIATWYPKVKVGGILAGHDYLNVLGFGVVKAVEEFVKRNNISLYLTHTNKELNVNERKAFVAEKSKSFDAKNINVDMVPNWYFQKT